MERVLTLFTLCFILSKSSANSPASMRPSFLLSMSSKALRRSAASFFLAYRSCKDKFTTVVIAQKAFVAKSFYNLQNRQLTLAAMSAIEVTAAKAEVGVRLDVSK